MRGTRLVVVTATTDRQRAWPCLASWGTTVDQIIVDNGRAQPYLGVVPAFRVGVDRALAETDAEVIACLHDDVEILDPAWVEKVLRHFDREPDCGLVGFGGAIGLGSDDLYRTPYDPMQLARVGFRSNMVDAEVHGVRSLLTERVACLDGFSQIGRRDFWYGEHRYPPAGRHTTGDVRPWTKLEHLGVIHHAYDAMLACLAQRYGWETWYLPVRCRHLGGQTAVGDAGYAEWAKSQIVEGDQGFWKTAHAICYREFRDVLPIRV